MHMGLVGLACAWKAAAPHASNFDAPTAVGHAIAIGAAVLFAIWVVLYALKAWFYWPKVRSDRMTPVRSRDLTDAASCACSPWLRARMGRRGLAGGGSPFLS